MHARRLPDAEIRGNGWQGAQHSPLDLEAGQRRLAGGAVAAQTGLFHHPAPGLGVEIDQIAEWLQGQEWPFPYVTPDSTMPFFCGSWGGHGSILKP